MSESGVTSWNSRTAALSFAFSSENWTRTDSEIVFLMTLFERTIKAELRELNNQGVRLKFVGDNESLPGSLVGAMRKAEKTTRSNDLLGLNICFNYGGKWDIVQGIKKLLIEQIYSTVKWRESLLCMHKLGVENFVEIGPGKVLSGLVKRIDKNE